MARGLGDTNEDVYSHLELDDLRADIEYQSGALEQFMQFFGFYRFNDTEFWEDPSYKKPYYDDEPVETRLWGVSENFFDYIGNSQYPGSGELMG